MSPKRKIKRTGEVIRGRRRDCRLTLPEAAALAGISKGNLSRIEHGGDFQISTLYRLCRALRTEPRHVLPDL